MDFPARFRPTRSGALVVLGLIAFGLLIVGGLYISPKAHPPEPPPNVPLGAPQRKLRMVTYDMARQHPANDAMFAELWKLEPDYIFLQGVNEDDVAEIAQLLRMEPSFHPQLYQRSERLAGSRGTWGNLILSRQSLYLGAPLGGKRGGFGAWAESIVDGSGFFVACIHLSAGPAGEAEAAEFEQVWKARRSPPMVAAVLPSDGKVPAALGFLPVATGAGGEWLCLTQEWSIGEIGTVPGAGSGMAPRWFEVSKRSTAETRH